MKIDNVVIVAGGLNTRFKELSKFPKLLLPLNNGKSILQQDVEVFDCANLFVVTNMKYYEMIKNYVTANNLNVKVIGTDNTNGSSNTLKSVMNELPNENTLLVWSDLVLDSIGFEGINKYECNTYYCVITKPGEYRFKIDSNNRIIPCELKNGNIPGIYYYKVKPTFEYNELEKSDYDFIQYINDYHNDNISNNEYVSTIFECRDLETYIKYYKNGEYVPNVRFFNKLTIENGTLTKECINDKYSHLINTEVKWYSLLNNLGFTNIPNIYNVEENKFKMQYLEGYYTIYDYINNHSDDKYNIVNKYIEVLNKLHGINSIDANSVYYTDAKIEYFDKVLNRCESIKHILLNYDNSELLKLLTYAFDILYNGENLNMKYYLFHGDPNGSNAMYNPQTNDLKLIDPRGYFGKSNECYGPIEYDYAKVRYLLTGYDEFNKGKYIYGDEPKSLINDETKLPNELTNIKTKLITAIIWISLAQYICQDVFKANIAYEHGIKMLKNIIDEYNEGLV